MSLKALLKAGLEKNCKEIGMF